MEPEDDSESCGQSQNLHDLQNYLVTFNKEIESNDGLLSNMDVDTDLYTSTGGSSLPDEVPVQFSSGFYTEHGILDGSLSDEPNPQMQSLVTASEPDNSVDIKQEVGTIDLEVVQAQMATFDTQQISETSTDMQQDQQINQSLLLSSVADNADIVGDKVIRIVSLGDDGGQFLALPNGQPMQILSQGIPTDLLHATDGSNYALSSVLTTSAGPITNSASVDLNTTIPLAAATTTSAATVGLVDTGQAELLTLPSSQVTAAPQLISLPNGVINTETIQMSSLLSTDGSSTGEIGYQTVAIVPSDIGQSGEIKYVLIMTPNDEEKFSTNSGVSQVFALKQEVQDIATDNIDKKRIFKSLPQKLQSSMNTGVPLMCDFCNYTSTKRYLLTRHMKSHSDVRPFKCKECDRGFKTAASLMNHENTHSGTRPHKCKTCESAFTTSGELVRHIRYRHTFERPHRCPNCDYASVELSKLKRHMRSHTGEKPYKCEHCTYASPDTYKLKRHMRIHTGEKPYQCDVCQARFTQSNSLKAHKLIHSGNKPVFQCHLCPTTCGRKTDLKIHFVKLHAVGSPVECKKCGKMFSDRYSFKQHMHSHDMDKCMKCEECDFITSTERMLEKHAATHNTGKKYVCEVCGSEFLQRQLLDKHRVATHAVSVLRAVKQEHKMYTDLKSIKPAQSLLPIKTAKDLNGELVSSGAAAPTASGTLHKNLMQDIKAGKLGEVPQVVIVHPDGSLEEISSRLPGSKMNVHNLLSSLCGDQSVEVTPSHFDEQMLDKKLEASSEEGDDVSKLDDGARSRLTETWISISDVSQLADKNTETSQCEASTQAEIESDSDSAAESTNTRQVQMSNKIPVPQIIVASTSSQPGETIPSSAVLKMAAEQKATGSISVLNHATSELEKSSDIEKEKIAQETITDKLLVTNPNCPQPNVISLSKDTVLKLISINESSTPTNANSIKLFSSSVKLPFNFGIESNSLLLNTQETNQNCDFVKEKTIDNDFDNAISQNTTAYTNITSLLESRELETILQTNRQIDKNVEVLNCNGYVDKDLNIMDKSITGVSERGSFKDLNPKECNSKTEETNQSQKFAKIDNCGKTALELEQSVSGLKSGREENKGNEKSVIELSPSQTTESENNDQVDKSDCFLKGTPEPSIQLEPSQDKVTKVKRSGKRSTQTDQSLVLSGKRVRKVLVKTSL